MSGQKVHDYLPEECIHRYHDDELVSFKRPILIDVDKPVPKQINFYIGKTFKVSAGELYRFHDAYLIGENAVGVTSDGHIILDTALDLPSVLPKCNPRLLMKYDRLSTDANFDTVISLVHIFCNAHYVNYFHWLTDSLLLLEGAQAYEAQFGKKVKVLVNDSPSSFQREFLALLGIPEDQCIQWTSNLRKARIKELVVVKSRRTGTNMDEIVSPQGLRWLRKEVLKRLPSSSKNYPSNIFLTRQNTASRRIVNFDELTPVLEGHNFAIVDTGKLPVAEQIHLFNNVEVLVGVHGAGFTNMAFSRKLKVLELIGNVDRPDDFQWYCAYYSMSQCLGHQYSFLECETIPLLDSKRTKQIYDLKVDVEQLDRMLKRLVRE